MRAVVAAQAADLATIIVTIALYGAATVEANPIMRGAYLAAGVAGLFALKGVLIGALALLRPLAGVRWPLLRGVGIAFGLIGATSNVVAIVALR